jgi:hypothetical protein
MNWHRTASEVEMLTKERPIVGDIPRDSLMAQIISSSPTPMVVAAVLGLERPVKGLKFVIVCLFEG